MPEVCNLPLVFDTGDGMIEMNDVLKMNHGRWRLSIAKSSGSLVPYAVWLEEALFNAKWKKTSGLVQPATARRMRTVRKERPT